MSKIYTFTTILLFSIFYTSNAKAQSISFEKAINVVNENNGNIVINLTLTSPTTSSVDVVLKPNSFNTADNNDFTFSSQTLNFTSSSSITQSITIPINNDNDIEQSAEYFVISLENPVGLTIGTNSITTIYIKDNENKAPIPNNAINLDYIASFDPSGAGASTCEIVVHDPASQKLFSISAISKKLDIINFSNPNSLSLISSIDMSPYGGITSVAVKNGIVAVASPNSNEQLDGSVVFFDTNGVFIKQVTVGALPDMIVFTPDGTKILTANEGQPNDSYSVDPEGSISIIDISGGVAALTQSNVTTLNFTSFNSQENSLIASGIRKTKSTSTLSQDFEPEFITISPDSQKAWVSLQENNAIADIDLATSSITSVWPLGANDVSTFGKGMDISDNNGQILIANWPIKAYRIPDAIANYNYNGVNYIVTANEGDEKEYTGLNERTTIGAVTLDPTVFPNAAMLKNSNNAGRLRISNLHGNTDADAEFEEIYCLGSRSFSIFDASSKDIVYDSGDDFETYLATTNPFSSIFNADHGSNTIKNRSRSKGPEPEGITLANLYGKTYAFISLERTGGVMVYDITNPTNVNFVDYKTSRNTSSYGGDNGPEGITFIAANDSPNNKNYIAVANEISGTIALFEVNSAFLSSKDFEHKKTFTIFPNPSNNGIVYFNRMASYELFNLSGKLIQSGENAYEISTTNMEKGFYILKTGEGFVQKLVIN